MSPRPGSSWIERFLHRRALRRWSRIARAAATEELDRLRLHGQRARALRTRLDNVIFEAEGRLALPRIGSTAFPRQPGTDWAWRPQMWRGPLTRRGLSGVQSKAMIGDEVTVFHDCRISELTILQIRNQAEEDLAPFGLRMDVFRFDGTFLSLAIDLPDEACEGLLRRHILRLDAVVTVEKPLDIFARLNVRHGPNTEQVVRELNVAGGERFVEFDLAYTRMNEKRVERLWVDLIFDGPEMNQVTIRDVTLSRYPRAEL